ncbi:MULTISPECIES: HEAT repeat domain-containing protein [unclassified Nocardiopsis]|uniref:HEAT repeat domain-containing protein n=1 Tax=Nocardiopsis TaxID=2013 RepID=UPI00387B2CB9
MHHKSDRPSFVQLGNHNTQYNHYYNLPSKNTKKILENDKIANLGPFSLTALLASESENMIIVNTVTEEMNRRMATPTSPVGDLLLCHRLAPVIAKHGNWQLRRAFSHSLSHVLAATSSTNEISRKISLDLLDYARDSANFSVMLSIATTASSSASQLFPGSTQEIHEFNHPQVLWQHSRDPSLSASNGGLRTLVDTVLNREDQWSKRKLISSSLLHSAKGKLDEWDEIKRLLESCNEDDIQYIRLILNWIDPLDRLDISNALPSPIRKFIKREKNTPSRLSLESLPIASPSLIRSNLEILSLDLDMQKMSTEISLDQPGLTGSSKGRYSPIEDTISYVLSNTHKELRESLILELLDSFDEGIRWATASQFDLGLPQGRVNDTEAKQVFKFLKDTHPWVAREALTTIARTNLAISEANLRKLAKSATAAVDHAVTQGWPKSELLPAIAALIVSEPEITKYLEISSKDG